MSAAKGDSGGREAPEHREQAARLARYELGLLQGEERRSFERHLLECDACFAELERGLPVAAALRAHAPALARALSRAEEGDRPQGARGSLPRTRSGFRAVMGRLQALLESAPRPSFAAAVALLLVLAGIGVHELLISTEPARLASFPRGAIATDLVRGTRRGDRARARGARELLQAGAAYFDLGNLEEAERRFRGALERDSTLAEAAYLLGLCAVRSGRPSEGLDEFEQALRHAGEELRERAAWTLANAHLAAGNVAEARQLLEGLSASQGELAERSRHLLARLPR